MYYVSQEYRLMVVESAEKTTAAGTEPCATVPRGNLLNRTFELELIPTPHKRHRDDGDALPVCKRRRGGVVEIPSLPQPAAEQPEASEPHIDTLPESSVTSHDYHPITAIDRLSEQKMISGINALKKALDILKTINNRTAMLQNASVHAVDRFRERSHDVLRTVDITLAGVKVAAVPDLVSLRDINTISKPELEKRMALWQAVGWKALKRVVELLTKKKHRKEFLAESTKEWLNMFRETCLEVLDTVEECCPTHLPRRQVR
jgi:hypothetical protein